MEEKKNILKYNIKKIKEKIPSVSWKEVFVK